MSPNVEVVEAVEAESTVVGPWQVFDMLKISWRRYEGLIDGKFAHR